MTQRADPQAPTARSPRLPPRAVIRTAWLGHRALHRVSGGRLGLSDPTPGGRFGMLRLRTRGRRSGRERAAIVGYVEHEGALITVAMNGWADAEPAWWLNLQADPEAIVELAGGVQRTVRARAATGEERDRLWAIVAAYSGYGDLDGLATRRSGETAVVVLEPPSFPTVAAR